jgi:hypothetical protein
MSAAETTRGKPAGPSSIGGERAIHRCFLHHTVVLRYKPAVLAAERVDWQSVSRPGPEGITPGRENKGGGIGFGSLK